MADRKLNEAERKAVLRGLIFRRRKAHDDHDMAVEDATSKRINTLLDEAINARAH
jgi:hypothetical protein